MNKSPLVIVINGTPGTGKSTVGNELESSGFMVLREAELVRKSGCVEGKDKETDAVIVEEDCYEKYLKALFGKMEKQAVIYEGHLGDLVPNHLVAKCFVLSLPIEILSERLRKRHYSEKKIQDNILAEIMKDCLIHSQEAFGIEKTVEIQNLESKETANRIIREIKSLFRERGQE